MDIEQLRLVLEAASAAGQGAYTLAIMWIAKDFLQFIIAMGLIVALIWCAYKLFSRLIAKHEFETDVMNALGISVYLTDEEKRQAIRWMQKGKNG